MKIKRNAYQYLLKWKGASNRKPLLIRGARQVGKTTLVREFKKEFTNYIEVNLEKDEERTLFDFDEIHDIINAAGLSKGVDISKGDTLFFIDEIQESPKAIKKLRFFLEEHPELFVIAAGSLLELALKDVESFPVGRVDYLYLNPLNFQEFIMATENKPAFEALQKIPLEQHAHNVLLKLFHEYAIIGGMPGIVASYLEDRNLQALSKSYRNLWQAYRDDVEKYGKNDTERKIIRHIMETAPSQNDRIKFARFGNSNYRSREVGESFRTLDKARIIQLIYPSTSLRPPIVTDYRKRPRLQFLDTGLLNQSLQIQAEMIGLKELDQFYKGRIIQHLVYQELISINEEIAFKPHFWVREEKDADAELDIIYPARGKLIPIEVKSGSSGKLKSLHQFLDKSRQNFAIRFYSGKFSIEKHKAISGKPFYLMNLPYYLVTKIHDYVDYYFDNYES